MGIEQGKQASAGFVALTVLVVRNEHKSLRCDGLEYLYEWDRKMVFWCLRDTRCSLDE